MEMEHNVKETLRIMGQQGDSLAQMCKDTRPDLVAQVEDFSSMFQALASQHPAVPPPRPTSSAATPDSSSSSSSASPNSSSSDSDSESFNSSGNAYFSLPIKMNSEETAVDSRVDDGAFHDQQNGKDEDVLERVPRYEELWLSKKKLQLSEDEIARLKTELNNSGSLVEDLQAQLELANREIEVKEAALEVERGTIVELQKQAADGANEWQSRLQSAEEEITLLKANLDSQSKRVLDLEERIVCYNYDLSDRDNEVATLKASLHDAHQRFSAEEVRLQSEIRGLSEKQHALEARVREWEVRGQTLEDKLRQCEAREVQFGTQISQLKAEADDKGGHVEVLNKNLDGLKLKYDMLVAEKDGLIAKVNALNAEVGCRDDRTRQIEEMVKQLESERAKVMAGWEGASSVVDELRWKVKELEEEVDRQRVEIAGGAEEKREAIRQLCFTLDHYRSGYKELHQAFVGRTRSRRGQSVMAS